jgi:hypothetical protein
VDELWSQDPSTVSGNLTKIKRLLQISHELGVEKPPVPMPGPWPVKDSFGMGVAIFLLKHSLNPGVTESTAQYDTVRKMKSAFVNVYFASVENQGSAIVGGRDWKKVVSMEAPIYSEFLGRFQAGRHSRMGDRVVKVLNYSHSRNPPCAPARTHGRTQALREPPN